MASETLHQLIKTHGLPPGSMVEKRNHGDGDFYCLDNPGESCLWAATIIEGEECEGMKLTEGKDDRIIAAVLAEEWRIFIERSHDGKMVNKAIAARVAFENYFDRAKQLPGEEQK